MNQVSMLGAYPPEMFHQPTTFQPQQHGQYTTGQYHYNPQWQGGTRTPGTRTVPQVPQQYPSPPPGVPMMQTYPVPQGLSRFCYEYPFNDKMNSSAWPQRTGDKLSSPPMVTGHQGTHVTPFQPHMMPNKPTIPHWKQMYSGQYQGQVSAQYNQRISAQQQQQQKSPLSGVYEPISPTKEDKQNPFELYGNTQANPELKPEPHQVNTTNTNTPDHFSEFAINMWKKFSIENEAKTKTLYQKRQNAASKRLFENDINASADGRQVLATQEQNFTEQVTISDDEEEDMALAMAVSKKRKTLRPSPKQRARNDYGFNGLSVGKPDLSQPPCGPPPPLIPISSVFSDIEATGQSPLKTTNSSPGIPPPLTVLPDLEMVSGWERIQKYVDYVNKWNNYVKDHKQTMGCMCQMEEITHLESRYQQILREWHTKCFGTKEAQHDVDEESKKQRMQDFLKGWEQMIHGYCIYLKAAVDGVYQCKMQKNGDIRRNSGQKRKMEEPSQIYVQPENVKRPHMDEWSVEKEVSNSVNINTCNSTTAGKSETQHLYYQTPNDSPTVRGDVNRNSVTVSSSSQEHSHGNNQGEIGQVSSPTHGVKLEVRKFLQNCGSYESVPKVQLEAWAAQFNLSFKTVQNLCFAEMVSIQIGR